MTQPTCDADAITRDRRELKYRLPSAMTAALMEQISARLAVTHHAQQVGEPVSDVWHYSTTVYFDTEDGDLFRAAVNGGVHVKVRAREYYDVHPDLTELAASTRDVVRHEGTLFVELKVHDGDRSRKQRTAILKRDLDALMARIEQLAEREQGADDAPASLHEVGVAIARLRAQLAKPLRPSCVVNYRRLAWGDSDTALRVTLDRDVCAFAPPAELWAHHDALTRDALGPPVHEEADSVVEIKSRGEPPFWLLTLLANCNARKVHYSKFVMASRAIQGP